MVSLHRCTTRASRLAVAGVTLTAMLLAGALAAGTASATVLTLSDAGTPLAPGGEFALFGDEGNVSVETPSEFLDCEFSAATLFISVLTNSKHSDSLEVQDTSGGEGDPCESANGNAFVMLGQLDRLTLRASGGATAGPAGLVIEYEHVHYRERPGHREGSEPVSCVYSAKKLTGTNTATATKQPLEVDVGAELKLSEVIASHQSKGLCPKHASLDVSLPGSEGAGERRIEEQTF